jgi:hypothetical protein
VTIQLEGNPLMERAPTRRWIAIIAVAIPSIAFAMLATLFIRTYIAPSTAALSASLLLAARTAQPAPAPAVKAPEAPPPAPVAEIEPPAPPPAAEPVPAASLPMLATLSIAPLSAELSAVETPMQPLAMATDGSSSSTNESEAAEAAHPIEGPVPLPHAKPRISLAMVTGPVPLPRPKPALEDTPSDLPRTDIHAAQ